MNNTNYPYKVKSLPYQLVSLEPIIDKTALSIHHDKIYVNYVEKLNLLIKENKSDDTVIKNSINYTSELLSIIDIPNFGRPNIESILNSDIQEAIDSAQYSNNSELRDLLISCKSKFNI